MSEDTLTTTTSPEAAPAEPSGDSTLLTKELPDSEAGKSGENAKSGQAAQGEGGLPDSPDGYSFAFDKSMSVDADLLNNFRAVAHEAGITQAQAKKLADLYAGHMVGQDRKRVDSLRQAVDGWEKEIKEGPNFVGQKADAQRALARYGSAELFQVMDETLLGSHPAMFRFMAAVGKALAEPGMGGKSSGSGPLTAEKIFYPNMK